MRIPVATAALAFAAIIASVTTASADPWKDESGKGRWREGYERRDYPRRERRAFKEEFRQGNCKIERKWEKDEYKEEIKCKGGRPPAYARTYRDRRGGEPRYRQDYDPYYQRDEISPRRGLYPYEANPFNPPY